MTRASYADLLSWQPAAYLARPGWTRSLLRLALKAAEGNPRRAAMLFRLPYRDLLVESRKARR